MSGRLEQFARRVAADQFFLASALMEYAHSEGLDDDALANRLHCVVGDLARIRLCRRPRLDPVGMREDTARIGDRFGIDPTLLAEIVRRAEAITALRRDAASERGAMLAARDRQDGHDTPEERS